MNKSSRVPWRNIYIIRPNLLLLRTNTTDITARVYTPAAPARYKPGRYRGPFHSTTRGRSAERMMLASNFTAKEITMTAAGSSTCAHVCVCVFTVVVL